MIVKKKEPLQKQTIVVVILMIVIGAGVILSNTITPWLGEVNRDIAVRDIKTDVTNHVTTEMNELGSLILETFKENRGLGKSEHFNQSQMLAEILYNLQQINKKMDNGTS